MTSHEILAILDSEFQRLEASNSQSLLKKYLTREVFDYLKTRQTPIFHATLWDCIRSGIANLDSVLGIYAPDVDAYTIFSDIFDPIIEEFHDGFRPIDKHPPCHIVDCDVLGHLDPTGEYVISTSMCCSRSIRGYPCNPCLDRKQLKEIQSQVMSALLSLKGELKGSYYKILGMKKRLRRQLCNDNMLFTKGDRFQQTAAVCRLWPIGRGVFFNQDKTFIVWVNEEDHLRFISRQTGGDFADVVHRLMTGVNEVEKIVPFSHSEHLGYLTFCPTNLGTGIRVSVHIKVPKLSKHGGTLNQIAIKYDLHVQSPGTDCAIAQGRFYVMNKRRLGLSEQRLFKALYDGISEMIQIEKELSTPF